MADWDERYSLGEHATSEPSRLLVRVARGLAPGRALDIACGAGRHAVFLAEHGWQVTAVDSSSVGIRLTEQRARERGVTVDARVADLERGEFSIDPEAYDLIIIFYYLQHDLWPQIRAGVRPGGLVVAAIHLIDESADTRPMNPAFLLQPEELRAEFSDWDIKHYHETLLQDDDPGQHQRRTAEIVASKNGKAVDSSQ
ncbi:MAG TPA: methyltransferase domain-containing protein [Pyrinomonadaceae bacterium]